MKTSKNYVGTKIGKFEILEQDQKNKTLYLKAKCTLCGKTASLFIDLSDIYFV